MDCRVKPGNDDFLLIQLFMSFHGLSVESMRRDFAGDRCGNRKDLPVDSTDKPWNDVKTRASGTVTHPPY